MSAKEPLHRKSKENQISANVTDLEASTAIMSLVVA